MQDTDHSPKRINVLSIDGGDIRGIVAAAILGALEKHLGKEVYAIFDLIAGTSTGGIIALGIATPANHGRPYRPTELIDLYASYGPRIFRKSLFTPLKALLGPKYRPEPLEEAVATYFGDTPLASAFVPLLVSSYDLHSQLPFFFKSHRIAQDASYDWPIKSIARATSAAPTFFPPLHLVRGDSDYTLIDGGVFANNPSVAAYAEARRIHPLATEFVVVSVGTGDRMDHITFAQARKWGLIGWAKQIIPVMMDSASEAADYELDWILGTAPCCKHYRLQPELKLARTTWTTPARRTSKISSVKPGTSSPRGPP